jgi:hypothetical protein
MQRRNPCDSDTGRSVAPIDHLQSLLLDTCINHDSIKVEIFRGADPRQIPASKSSNYHRQSSMAVGHLFHSSILCRYRHQALFSRHRTINTTFHYSSTTFLLPIPPQCCENDDVAPQISYTRLQTSIGLPAISYLLSPPAPSEVQKKQASI